MLEFASCCRNECLVQPYTVVVTKKALNYTWRQLASRAGITSSDSHGTGFEALPLSITYGKPAQTLGDKQGIEVMPCAKDTWHNLLTLPASSLAWLPQDRVLPTGAALPFSDPIPVLFWGAGYEDGHKPFAERRDDGTVVFYADIISATLFMLTRWEETIVPDRDEHNRFPAVASVAYKQGFLDHPIVDEYALILREWLKVLLPNWQPRPRAFTVQLTHDIDSLRNFVSLPLALRILTGDLLKRRDVQLARQTFRDAVQQVANPWEMDHFKGLAELVRISQAAGFGRDAFYVMTTNPALLQSDYNYRSPLLHAAFHNLRAQDFEIGLHAGYTTPNNPEKLAEEKARLDILLGEQHYGGRQHYLRFTVPDTWRHWESAGLTYDATLGYPKREGFRCGTCHPFHPFDIECDSELALWEHPLIVMDGTLKLHRQLTPKQGGQCILELAHRCQAVGGNFVLLWHNSSLHRDWQPWGEMYTRVVHELAQW